ncbi:two-component system, cell cycle response regulator [Mariprofundus micogutta]|uniref:diguanylate cyclase n=1 Tax=Mariprofundus micogutta TaxID=1921010 RepID=A0A1L8CK97_9PROT|nr:diguanylate cyclase [Mariprofundus micogutta]GAV19336.1 two-component system, cell cycle response regulator [Mariprofundus micogutta]
MKLKAKVNRLTIFATVVLAVLVSSVVSVLIRDYAEEQARNEGLIVVEMAKIGLLHSMQEGVAFANDKEHVRNEINLMFQEFASLPELIEMRALRGESVTRQYGQVAGRGEIEEVERQMLASGEASETIEINERGIKVFHYNGPLIASSRNRLNCMTCHDAAEGEVLGGLSVQVDLTKAENAISSAIYQLVALLLLVGVLFAFALRKLFMPMVMVINQITGAFHRAHNGDFTHRINYRSDDEIGSIADATNELMESLSENVGAIARDVEALTGRGNQGTNVKPMQHMANVVHNLTTAVRFKEEIEADRDLDEVYAHIQRVLVNDFDIDKFTMYEVSSQRNSSIPVLSAGLPEGFDSWCSKEVQGDADACRAKRSVRTVDSRSDSEICLPFCADCKESCATLRHICLPVLNSEGDGVTLQLVFDLDQQGEIEKKVSLLQYYLRVAAPEIEAKRLMRSLKETALRDALTNMYNRRFLEDYANSMESSVTRRGSTVGVLMCDIDLFKQVNDKRGHASGDMVLVETASILVETLRASDLVVRYGGEEIVVLLMDTDDQRSMEVAERIRSNIESYVMRDEQGSFGITMSIGLSMYPENGSTLNECIKNADSALYKAKETGRNRVICHK